LPMLGGMTSTLVLTLIVIPAIYYVWVGRAFGANPKREHTKVPITQLTPKGDTA